MDIMKILNKTKENSIAKFLIDENWSNIICIYEEILEQIEKICKKWIIEENPNDAFGDRILYGELTEKGINNITNVLITHQEFFLLTEENRDIINKAVFRVLFKEKISPVTDAYIKDDKYIIEIFDSSYIPF